MKTKKLSLANIQGKLNRAEMKSILGGLQRCNVTADCGVVSCDYSPSVYSTLVCIDNVCKTEICWGNIT